MAKINLKLLRDRIHWLDDYAEGMTGTIEEVKQKSLESQQAAKRMDEATDGLTQQADDLKGVAAEFQNGGR